MTARREPELARDDLFGEVAFADEERHGKGAGRLDTAQHAREGGFQFPEGLQHLPEHAAPPQRLGVLVHGRGRLRIQGGAVADQDQRRVLECGIGHGGS
jgi:hypothetical protein